MRFLGAHLFAHVCMRARRIPCRDFAQSNAAEEKEALESEWAAIKAEREQLEALVAEAIARTRCACMYTHDYSHAYPNVYTHVCAHMLCQGT